MVLERQSVVCNCADLALYCFVEMLETMHLVERGAGVSRTHARLSNSKRLTHLLLPRGVSNAGILHGTHIDAHTQSFLFISSGFTRYNKKISDHGQITLCNFGWPHSSAFAASTPNLLCILPTHLTHTPLVPLWPHKDSSDSASSCVADHGASSGGCAGLCVRTLRHWCW